MRTEDYRKNYTTSLDSLEYLIEHPYRASLKKLLLPNFISRRLYGTQNSTVFNLATHLCLMGFHQDLPTLEKTLLGNSGDVIDPKKQLKDLLNVLYTLFDDLSKNPDIAALDKKIEKLKKEIDENPSSNHTKKKEEIASSEKIIENHNAALKTFKKLLHQFARENHFQCRLIKIAKLDRNLRRKLEPLNEGTNKFIVIEGKLRVISDLKKGFTNRKYALLPSSSDNSFNYETEGVSFEMGGVAFDEEIKEQEEERTKKRKIKSRLNKGSLLVSILVGVGEGLVATFFAATTFPFFIALLVVGTLGFICNYVLFRKASFSILKDLFFGKVWKKNNGEPLTRAEKAFVSFSLIFSLGAGLSFGFLAFGSGITCFTGLLVAIGLAANPFGILALAGLIAIATAVALFTVFAYMTVNWIRDGGPGRLKKNLLNLKTNFINFWKHDVWSELNFRERVQHIAIKALGGFRNFFCFSIALVAVILLNIATIGIFKHQTANIFQTVFNVGQRLSSLLAWVLVAGIGGIINSIFYGDSLLKVLKDLKVFCFKAASVVGSAFAFAVLATFTNKKSWKPVGTTLVKAIKNFGKFIFKVTNPILNVIKDISFHTLTGIVEKIINASIRSFLKSRRARTVGDRRTSVKERKPFEKNRVRFIHRVLSKLKLISFLPSVIMNAFGQGMAGAGATSAIKATNYITNNHTAAVGTAISLRGGGSAGANAAAGKRTFAIPVDEVSVAKNRSSLFHQTNEQPESPLDRQEEEGINPPPSYAS